MFVARDVGGCNKMALKEDLQKALAELRKEKERKFIYWEESNNLKEYYREKTKMGVRGNEKEMTIVQLKVFLDRGRDKFILI